MKRKIAFYLSLVVFSVLYYALVYTGSQGGDYLLYGYKFSLNPQEGAPWPLVHEKIASIWDIIYSQYVHYFYVNGRSIVHAIIQLFTTFRYDICCIIATIVFAITLLLAQKVCFTHPKQGLLPRFVIVLAVFICCCSPSTILGIVGALNYLWPLTFCLIFILLFDRPLNLWQKCAFFVVALLSGWSHEALAVPISAAYFVYLILERKTIKSHQVVGILLLLLGTILVVFAPGNFIKFFTAHDMEHSGLLSLIKQHLKLIIHLRLTYVLLAVLSYLAVKKILCSFIVAHKYWFVALATSFLFILVVGTINPRSVFFIDMIAGGLLCVFIDEYLKPISEQRLIIVVAFIAIPLSISSSYYRSLRKQNTKMIEQQLAASQEQVININVQSVGVPYILEPYVGVPSRSMEKIISSWREEVYEFVYQKQDVKINYDTKTD